LHLVDDGRFPLYEVVLFDMVPGISDQTEVESKIMNASDLHCQDFFGLEEMVEISL
jgi:hypothetical protein